MLHSGSRALLVVMLALLPVAARAQLTLTSVALDVQVEATNGTDSVFKVAFTVTGTEIATAKITPQGSGGATIDIPCTSATTCTVTQNLNQTQFNQLFPTSARDFKIDLTQVSPGTETITDTVSFTLPVVPSPAISDPTPGTPIDPTKLDVKFSACAGCTQTTRAVLTQGTTELASADLPATSTNWNPGVELAANSDFSVRITHQTSGSLTPAPRYSPGDVVYAFTFAVKHSDTVAFSTGSPPPTGAFCIILLDTTLAGPPGSPPGADCAFLDDTAVGILDTSGNFATTLGGIPIEYQTTLGPKGAVSGTAVADLDGDASFETSAPLVGRLRGKDGALRQRLRVRFVNDALDAKLQLRILEEANLASLAQSPELTTLLSEQLRGKQGGAKVDATSSSTPVIVDPPIGWRLDFNLAGSEHDITGQLQAAGSMVTVLGTQSFDTAKNLSDIRLSSGGAERGIQLRIKKLAIGATTITSGEFKFRAFGQSGSGLLP